MPCLFYIDKKYSDNKSSVLEYFIFNIKHHGNIIFYNHNFQVMVNLREFHFLD